MMHGPTKLRQLLSAYVPGTIRRSVERIVLPPYPPEYDQHKTLFVHIPKTAGKSIIAMFHSRGAVHLKLSDYERILGDRIDDYFIFTVVRHPVDRFVSAFAYLSRGGNQSYDDRRFRRRWIGELSLEEFTAGPFLRPEVRRSIFFLPQVEYLRSRSGRDRGVMILRFERLAADFRPVAARLAIGDELPHFNRSERNLPGSRLSAQAIGTLVECYREDFERFGYALPASARPES